MTFSENRYEWWAGYDREDVICIGPHKSKQDAIDEAISSQTYNEFEEDGVWKISIYVVEGVKPRPADMKIDCQRLLEDLECSTYEEWAGEEGMWTNVTDEQGKDLENRINRAFTHWAEINNIKFYSWMFAETRNEETVVLKHPLEDQKP